jgi:hypothetical protein
MLESLHAGKKKNLEIFLFETTNELVVTAARRQSFSEWHDICFRFSEWHDICFSSRLLPGGRGLVHAVVCKVITKPLLGGALSAAIALRGGLVEV